MKKHLLLFTLLSLLTFTQVGWGQTTYTWIGGVSDWNTASNWDPARNTPANNDIIQFTAAASMQAYNVPSQTIDQLIISTNSIVALVAASSSCTFTITSSVTVNGTLDLQSNVLAGTGTFILGATGKLKVSNPNGIPGAVTVSGTKTFTDGASYEFGGNPTTTPFISSVVATNISIYHWVTLNKDVSVSGVVTVQSPLTLGSNNLTLQSSATIVGSGSSLGSNYRMIDASGSGELRKVFTATGSFTFPVGTAISNTYSPVTVNFTSGTFSSAYVGAKFINSKHPNNTSATNYLNRYWTITQSGISSFSCDVTATYVTSDVAGTEASIYCGAYNGSAWTLYGATNTGSHQLTATAVTSFPADFTGGETSALPVELTSFTALARGSKVELNWQTATEVNNYGFNVELRIANGEWKKIGFVQGHGNSNSPKEYSFTDSSPLAGKVQYRLKQIDFDGRFEYSNIVEVNVKTPASFTLNQNYPNPFNPTSTIRYDIPKIGFVNISVYDILGKEIRVLVNEEKSPGHYEIIFDAKELASGIYFYTIKAADFTQSKKMIVMK